MTYFRTVYLYSMHLYFMSSNFKYLLHLLLLCYTLYIHTLQIHYLRKKYSHTLHFSINLPQQKQVKHFPDSKLLKVKTQVSFLIILYYTVQHSFPEEETLDFCLFSLLPIMESIISALIGRKKKTVQNSTSISQACLIRLLFVDKGHLQFVFWPTNVKQNINVN